MKNIMHRNPRKFFMASGIALAMTAISGAAVAETVSQDVIEARQESQISTTYALSPYLRANDIKVAVNNGKATLSGKVDESANKELAKQIALGVGGIKDVDNQIVVLPDYVPAPRTADRSYYEVIDDASISTAIASKLVWSKYTDGLNTQVSTKLGKVMLQGTAESAQVKELAGQLALNTRGVVSVDNQMVIGPKSTLVKTVQGTSQEVAKDVSDSWITAKVKSTFRYSSNVEGSDIAVSTKAGVVTLSGKVGSGAERALAVELAKNVRGVRSVQSTGLTI